MVYSTRRFVVCLSMCHFVLVFFSPFSIAITSLGEERGNLILVLFVRLFDLCSFRFVGFLFLLGSGKGCGLWLWHPLDFSLTFFKPPVVYSTDRSQVVVPVLVLLFGALWFILRGDLLYVLPCAILFLCFSVLLALRLPRLGKRVCLIWA